MSPRLVRYLERKAADVVPNVQGRDETTEPSVRGPAARGQRKGQAVSQPGPDERLRQRLAHLPDACRALVAALERQATRGGGDIVVRLQVGREGDVETVEVATVYERRSGT